MKKGGIFGLDRQREQLAKEREEAEKEVLAKVAAEHREWFGMLLRCAQYASSWSEEHELWLNQICDFLAYSCLKEFGRRLVQAGTFDKVDDIWYITYEDLVKIAYAPKRYNMRVRVQSLRAQWEEYRKTPRPPVITKMSPEQAFSWLMTSKDAIVLKVVVGMLPTPRPELKADLYGTCGAPGVVEGIARVIMSVDQCGYIQPGDILVAPGTTVDWTAVFPLLSGVVVDRGGSLSHAAICSREYSIPCVLNTFEATGKIKTGQRIRVDANMGAVYILG